MTIDEAAALIAHSSLDGSTWADLGCGDGTFTRALATLLQDGSTIHAMDQDRRALAGMPRRYADAALVTHVGDFTAQPWPFGDLDGALFANSLHYVRDKAGLLRACATAFSRQRLLIVEYDTDIANPWVPYPVSAGKLAQVLTEAGLSKVTWLATRPSRYRSAALYAVLAEA